MAVLKNLQVYGQTPGPQSLNLSVFANGKLMFFVNTPRLVNIFDSLVCAGCVKCISRFTFYFQQSGANT